MIVPVICATDKTHVTNFSGAQHPWLLNLAIRNVRTDIHREPRNCASDHIGLIACPPNGANDNDEAWHIAVVST